MNTQPKGVWRGGMVSNEWIRSIRMRMEHRVKRKYDKRSQSLTSHNSITTSSNPPCSFLLKVRMTFAEHTGTRGELKEAMRPSGEYTSQLGKTLADTKGALHHIFILILLLQAVTERTTLLEHK